MTSFLLFLKFFWASLSGTLLGCATHGGPQPGRVSKRKGLFWELKVGRMRALVWDFPGFYEFSRVLL